MNGSPSAVDRSCMVRVEHLIPVGRGHVLAVTDFPARDPIALVVMCHGLTGTRVGPQRLLTVLAEELTLGGFLCVRFDFRGSGDSSGEFSTTTFTSMRRDVEVVARWTRKRYGDRPIGLVGLSIGGVPLALAATRIPGVAAAVLLSSDLIEDVYFPGIARTEPIRGGEFHLAEVFWRERERLRPFTELVRAGIPVKLFYGDQDHDLTREAARFRDAGFAVEQLKGVGHLFEDLEVRRFMGRRIVRFLRQSLGPRTPAGRRP
jgi:pimeloyl-ACP methyl ester carboxylesterase